MGTFGVPSASLRRQLDRWLFRVGRPETAPIRLAQRRIYVLPTRSGLVFAAALIVMLIASINYALSLGYMLTFLIGGIGVTSIVHAFRNLLHLSINGGRAPAVFCGEPAEFRLFVENARNERRPAFRLRALDGLSTFDLKAESTTEVSLRCTTSRRGRLALGRTVLETTWPLGLIRAWSVFVPDVSCLVYPAPERDAPPLPADGAGSTNGGSRTQAGDDDFAGLRPHQTSDSLRHVAWKVLARGGPLLTKQFSTTQGGERLLDWHALPAQLDTEARIARLTAWVLAAERTGQPFSLVLPGAVMPIGRGPGHLHACCRLLALHGQRDADSD